MKIGDPIYVPVDDLELPETFIAETELSGITLYGVKTQSVAGLGEALEGKAGDYAVLVYYPDEEFAHVYLYASEEEVLEDIWDIEYRIANFIYS